MTAFAWMLTLRVIVLGLFNPTHVELTTDHEQRDVHLVGTTLVVQGQPHDAVRVVGHPAVRVTIRDTAGRLRFTRRFRGTIVARPNGSSIALINELDPEDYVAGSVAAEMDSDHPQALRTQAVLARTIALGPPRHAREGAALCDLTHCQVYRGMDGETDAARAAATATAGEVLAGADQHLAAVYFTGVCGGNTTSAAEVWPGHRGAAHLTSHPCAVCQRDVTTWQRRITLAELSTALDGEGRIRGLRILERGAGGYARRVLIEGTNRIVSGEHLRIVTGRSLGWDRLPSAQIDRIDPSGDTLIFSGVGRGHGVGVCQHAVAVLARQGLDYHAILRRYLPGTSVQQHRSPDRVP